MISFRIQYIFGVEKEMKKLPKNLHLFIIACISLQLVLMPRVTSGDTAFVNSFWNTLDFGDYNVLTDWSEAGRIDFSVLDFTGILYIKNDFNSLYIGIRIRENITDNMTWRINFDVDADGEWAEDAKTITLQVKPEKLVFSYEDEYYIQNYAQSFPDSQPDNFDASMRTFTSVGLINTIFELKIPFQTNDLLYDLQVQSPETTIIGLSMDAYYIDTGLNGTWRGDSYPDFANASNYIQILFAGPQDRKIPMFEGEEPLPKTTQTTKEESETESEDTSGEYGIAAASSFEVWIAFLGILATAIILSKFGRRNKT